ncbi:ribosomal RNA-processing protein 1 [Rhizophlyctis rosea]|uniref:Ribosomal RNA-processing protein 1 n=1 Tax=Rhizophlyctis rosea TaxID=64517 RepID=A0AAD5SD86_9FUNG|nr:ribosomal RNA-processing protein 1 [Rhizophlyctis rosea]
MTDDPQDFTFGKRLAHTEKKVRDQAVRALTQWLTSKDDITDLEMMKLWKALFYCFWMSDKQPIQLHLADRLSSLTLELKSDLPLRYVEAFWKTMAKEWRGLDRLRLDKFYMLLRKFHGAAFRYLEKSGWDEELVERYLGILRELPLRINDMNGMPESLCYHTSEVYIDEMDKAVEADVPEKVCTDLLSPYFDILQRNASTQIYERMKEHIFEKVLELSTSPESDSKLHFDLPLIGRRIHEIALAPETLKKNRPFAKELFKKYAAVVDFGVDAGSLDEKKGGKKGVVAGLKSALTEFLVAAEEAKPEQNGEVEKGEEMVVTNGVNGSGSNGKRKAESMDTPVTEAPKKKKKKKGAKKEEAAPASKAHDMEVDSEVVVEQVEAVLELEEVTALPETPQQQPKKKSKKKTTTKEETAAVGSESTEKKAVRWNKDLEKVKTFKKLDVLGSPSASPSQSEQPAPKPVLKASPTPVAKASAKVDGYAGAKQVKKGKSGKRATAADFM